MLRITICLLCVFLRWTSPLPQDSELRSIGGREAIEGQFPWQVALFATTQELPLSSFHCGGSIISPQWILTAGHCVYMVTSVRVVSGTINLDHQENTIEAEYWKMHEQYTEIYSGIANNDIGVVKLSQPLTFNQNTRAIGLSSNMLPGYVTVIVSGWGMTQDYTSKFFMPSRLHYVDLVTTSSDQCVLDYLHTKGSLFCAISNEPNKAKSGSPGDSGGPVVTFAYGNSLLVGVVSGGKPGIISGFTNVAYYRDWIRSNTYI